MKTFKFFQKFVPYQMELHFTQPRYPRFPTRQVPAIEGYDTPELRSIFLAGWRACEHGREIFDNPYSTREELIYSLHRAWERGWLECYHNHPSRTRQYTDEDLYLAGWESARSGRPNHDNPYNNVNLNGWINIDVITHYKTMWDLGWNDFINDH
jgi:hypothetical protein